MSDMESSWLIDVPSADDPAALRSFLAGLYRITPKDIAVRDAIEMAERLLADIEDDVERERHEVV